MKSLPGKQVWICVDSIIFAQPKCNFCGAVYTEININIQKDTYRNFISYGNKWMLKAFLA